MPHQLTIIDGVNKNFGFHRIWPTTSRTVCGEMRVPHLDEHGPCHVPLRRQSLDSAASAQYASTGYALHPRTQAVPPVPPTILVLKSADFPITKSL
jgi:hypothetical protein